MTEALAWPPTKHDLERLYLVERLSAAKIAKAYGLKYKNPKVGESTVLYHLKRNGIERRDPAEHVRKVTEEMVDEWVVRYLTGESLKRIAEDLVDPVTVWNRLTARGLVLRDKVEAQIKAVTKYERKPFNGDSIEKAYLIGLRYGDLHAVKHGRAVRVRVSTTHPAMADLFESVFSPYGHVHRYPRRAKLVGYEWTLECDLDSSFGFLLRKPTVPELEQLDEAEFLAFLAGFFDAEGTIYLHKKASGPVPELSVANTDVGLLRLIHRTLTGMGFHPAINHKKQAANRIPGVQLGEIWRLGIWRVAEVERVLALLAVKHREKVDKARIVRSYLAREIGIDELEEAWGILIDSIERARSVYLNRARALVETGSPIAKQE